MIDVNKIVNEQAENLKDMSGEQKTKCNRNYNHFREFYELYMEERRKEK